MKRLFFIQLLLIGLFSCKQDNRIEIKKTSHKYPSVPCKDSAFVNYFFKTSERYLNLSSIGDGVDSFEMRVYIIQPFDAITELYLVKATQDSLTKSHYYFKPQLRINPDGTVGNTKPNFSLMSVFNFKNSDTSFWSLLKETRVDTFLTQELIPNLKGGCTDGEMYFVELATKETYRALLYSTPRCYENSVDNLNFEVFIQKLLSSIIHNEKYKNDYFLKNHFKY